MLNATQNVVAEHGFLCIEKMNKKEGKKGDTKL